MPWSFAAEGGWQEYHFGTFEVIAVLVVVVAVIAGAMLLVRRLRQDKGE